jgi:hypothetical protein
MLGGGGARAHRAAAYPVTICWEPSQDQTPSEDPWDTFSFRSTYTPEAQRVEESTPEPRAATANHRWGISDVTIREQQHEQEHPAARRGGRRVNASETSMCKREEEEKGVVVFLPELGCLAAYICYVPCASICLC